MSLCDVMHNPEHICEGLRVGKCAIKTKKACYVVQIMSSRGLRVRDALLTALKQILKPLWRQFTHLKHDNILYWSVMCTDMVKIHPTLEKSGHEMQ